MLDRGIALTAALVVIGLAGCGSAGHQESKTEATPENVEQVALSESAVDGTRSGVIADAMCAPRHAPKIKSGEVRSTDPDCVLHCVDGGSKFVLITAESDQPYVLLDQKRPREFAGKWVTVVGRVDDATHRIDVQEIELGEEAGRK